ncbi:hypothetical protein [Roseibium album]|uniref:Uncharacterized protein n=1 Tax=Roseibium album TaxID=311410 RepID=A0A0M7B2P2_9HYPH|nr:hypothetical protein [Roseibium album]CTQ63459.1 hypothetical protein LA5094_06258 [Roseibium album]CTQ79494.1 hypothetical protein LA5096_06220 [Roseibium album]CTQ81046.1 hypothetical protein LA5095_06288 [Roseibium album]
MKRPKRVQLITYLDPDIHQRIVTHAKRTNMSVSKVAERILQSGKYPDRSLEQSILNLLHVNADQARLGNLLLKGMNESTDGHLVRQMQSLLREVRQTQGEIKACIADLKP